MTGNLLLCEFHIRRYTGIIHSGFAIFGRFCSRNIITDSAFYRFYRISLGHNDLPVLGTPDEEMV